MERYGDSTARRTVLRSVDFLFHHMHEISMDHAMHPNNHVPHSRQQAAFRGGRTGHETQSDSTIASCVDPSHLHRACCATHTRIYVNPPPPQRGPARSGRMKVVDEVGKEFMLERQLYTWRFKGSPEPTPQRTPARSGRMKVVVVSMK